MDAPVSRLGVRTRRSSRAVFLFRAFDIRRPKRIKISEPSAFALPNEYLAGYLSKIYPPPESMPPGLFAFACSTFSFC